MFTKGKSGNPGGRPQGAKSKKTLAWEALTEGMLDKQSENFHKYLNDLWNSKDMKEKQLAADLFIKLIEYVKPKQQRVVSENRNINENIELTLNLDPLGSQNEAELPKALGSGVPEEDN